MEATNKHAVSRINIINNIMDNIKNIRPIFGPRLQNCENRLLARHVCLSVRLKQLDSRWADFH